MSSGSREEILHRVRKGLSTVKEPAPMRVSDSNISNNAREIKSILNKNNEALIDKFSTEIQNVNTTVVRAQNEDKLVNNILELIQDKQLNTFTIWDTPYLKELGIKDTLKEKGLKVVTVKNKTSLATADIGITEADYAIADTGTLVLLTDSKRPRGVSLVPPIHLAVVKPENIVNNINDLFIILKDRIDTSQEMKSCMTFITGPSRTADIELNLTLGVHGPKELYVLLLDS